MSLNTLFIFKIVDLALAAVIYTLSAVAILRYPHGYIIPLVIFGLFLFPLQFAIWFIPIKIFEVNILSFQVSDIVYLLLIKVILIISIFMP